MVSDSWASWASGLWAPGQLDVCKAGVLREGFGLGGQEAADGLLHLTRAEGQEGQHVRQAAPDLALAEEAVLLGSAWLGLVVATFILALTLTPSLSVDGRGMAQLRIHGIAKLCLKRDL